MTRFAIFVALLSAVPALASARSSTPPQPNRCVETVLAVDSGAASKECPAEIMA